MRPRNVLAGSALLAICAGAGCFRETDVRGPEVRPATVAVDTETVAAGLVVPWALAFAPDGRLFITERPGRIRVVEAGELRPEPWADLGERVAATGEAGLMGLALAPDFEHSGELFVCLTRRRPDRELENVVWRLRERDGVGGEPAPVVTGLPAARFHAGCAVAFGPDGRLYVTTGDARDPGRAARRDSRNAKVLRYTRDGGVPSDGALPGSPVFANGLRNAQGLAWHPGSGTLFATEHGPSGFPDERFRRGDDEVNAVLPGADYGWPAVTGDRGDERYVRPLVVWSPAIAPSGLAHYDGPFEPWRGSLFVGALRGAQLQRLELVRAPDRSPPWRVRRQEVYLDGWLGRLRAVAVGPDRALYVGTSNRDGRGSPAETDDRVLRIVPRP